MTQKVDLMIRDFKKMLIARLRALADSIEKNMKQKD